MKMTFTGRDHNAGPHLHDVRGFYDTGFHFKGNAYEASGQIVELLGGKSDYSVKFEFAKEELIDWLQEFVENEPEAAIKLAAQMQAEAIIALARESSKKGGGK